MFGSLLAAYVLGLIGFVVDRIQIGVHSTPWWLAWEPVPNAAYLFIALSYAFVTAGLYLSYHTGILGVPTQLLRFDFALALVQSVAFGLSMHYPNWFPLLLALAPVASFFRKLIKPKSLADHLNRASDAKPELRVNRDGNQMRESGKKTSR